MPQVINSPTLWGPSAWMTIHSVAAGFPESPTDIDRLRYKQWLEGLVWTLPCPDCRKHFQSHVESSPVNASSRQTLFQWTWELHNSVNDRLRKMARPDLKTAGSWYGVSFVAPVALQVVYPLPPVPQAAAIPVGHYAKNFAQWPKGSFPRQYGAVPYTAASATVTAAQNLSAMRKQPLTLQQQARPRNKCPCSRR